MKTSGTCKVGVNGKVYNLKNLEGYYSSVFGINCRSSISSEKPSASEQRHSRNFSEINVKTLASLRRGYKYTHQFHKISSKVVQVKLRKNTNEKNFQFEPVF